ncbi:MAG: endonuclease [Paludibacteraceae bacterium]|nr:endonuclease [Paludibacteraceae bacterium]
MRKSFLLILASLFTLCLSAEQYTIVFNSGNADSSSPTTALSSIIYSATNNCVNEIRRANCIYRAKEGYGIKGGKTTAKGELTLGLDDNYSITSLTVYAASVNGKDSISTSKITRGIIICGQYFDYEEGHRTELRPYKVTLNSTTDSITIESDTTNYNRWYVQKIEFEAENPHPNWGITEMPYAQMNFGSVHWESEDEPMEDILNFEIVGKNIVGNIELSLSSGKYFTLTDTQLPAEGGEVGIFYSITMKEVTKAFPLEDEVTATCQGADGIERSRTLPIVLTIVPPSSGASTFVLDTSRMAIGPMPGDYYKYAQHTADSTLKNHLGYIICCGQRYRYGSGSKKSWDAFFHTDRDTVTNQVLDMYSNNVRYFDPEKPTASVKDFDIEHMLPKSWWGGDVNPAYCDIFHLVPGDYSANRSKSNHAPGIPADSSFYNGSFVTGQDTIHGLQRVFCPADEYKGDFARAYFYIATCYGDSLTWLESGEPSQAVTNEGWQEFRPWLRDLLLSWHRLDPVSKKELDRAVEVNKIQGNRNPFIDYPDLVEYIWGDKQGTPVDFTQLTQSYRDQYSEETTGVDETFISLPTYKEIRGGQVVIIRNGEKFSILGQPLQ